MTVKDIINNNKDIPRNKLNMLISYFFPQEKEELTDEDTKFILNKIEELRASKPIQYVIGNVDFYGNIINVNENVLIPRFETEGLIEELITLLKQRFTKKIDILDIGTGSGCIAITLKKKIDCNMDAVDISSSALSVAKENALENDVKINFFESDMLSNVTKKFDCIVSNPPYISYDEEIEDKVKNNEPNIALYASENGLFYYKEILKNAKKHLNEKSIIAFEIGFKQGKELTDIAKSYFPNANIILKKDLSLKDRYLFIINE